MWLATKKLEQKFTNGKNLKIGAAATVAAAAAVVTAAAVILVTSNYY